MMSRLARTERPQARTADEFERYRDWWEFAGRARAFADAVGADFGGPAPPRDSEEWT
jgi:hypothetical protein